MPPRRSSLPRITIAALLMASMILYTTSFARHDEPDWWKSAGLPEDASHVRQFNTKTKKLLQHTSNKQEFSEPPVNGHDLAGNRRYLNDNAPDAKGADSFDLRNGVDYFADYDPSKLEVPPPDLRPDLKFHFPTLETSKWRFILMSVEPRIYYVPDFLTDEECDELIRVGNASMVRSTVVNEKNRKEAPNGVSEVRTSTQTWLHTEDYPAKSVADRVREFTGIQKHEELQILRYQKDQHYIAHQDYFSTKRHGPQPDNRAATAYMYLTTVQEGGETQFPRASGKPMNYDFRSCQYGLRVKPHKRALVVFYDMTPDGKFDPYALHGGCEPKVGEKWGAVLWMHIDTPMEQIESISDGD